MTDRKLTLDIPEDLLDEIEKYRIDANKESMPEAVRELLKSALNMPEHYRNFDWEKAEKEVDDYRSAGNTKTVNSAGDLVKDLES